MLLAMADRWILIQSKHCISLLGMYAENKPEIFKYVCGELDSLFLGK